MTERIQEMIQILEKENDSPVVYLKEGVHKDSIVSLIDGNPQGLRLLAAELLKRSVEIEKNYGADHSRNLSKKEFPADVEKGFSADITARELEILNRQLEKVKGQNAPANTGILLALSFVVTLMIFGIIFIIQLF